MKLNQHYLGLYLLLFFVVSWGPQALAKKNLPLELSKDRLLLDVLEDLSERYDVFFSYETKLLEELSVDFQFKKGESLEIAVDRLLNSVGLEYKDLAYKHEPNWPLRGTKWKVYEGGVRTPLIVRWPNHIPEGASSDALLGLNDLMATTAEVVGYELPSDRRIDSYNQLPNLMGKEQPIRKEIIV